MSTSQVDEALSSVSVCGTSGLVSDGLLPGPRDFPAGPGWCCWLSVLGPLCDGGGHTWT